jgi:DNA gyrase/topoisomerase IV subunit A
MTITTGGTVTRQAIADIRQTGRATQGVIVQRLREEDERIAAIAIVRDPGDADAVTELGENDAPEAAVADIEALADDIAAAADDDE